MAAEWDARARFTDVKPVDVEYAPGTEAAPGGYTQNAYAAGLGLAAELPEHRDRGILYYQPGEKDKLPEFNARCQVYPYIMTQDWMP